MTGWTLEPKVDPDRLPFLLGDGLELRGYALVGCKLVVVTFSPADELAQPSRRTHITRHSRQAPNLAVGEVVPRSATNCRSMHPQTLKRLPTRYVLVSNLEFLDRARKRAWVRGYVLVVVVVIRGRHTGTRGDARITLK